MKRTRANIGSLSSQANEVRKEKKDSASTKKAPLSRARESAKPFKSADVVQDSSSDSESSSNSDSDSDADLAAARAGFLAKQSAKKGDSNTGVNGAAKSVTTPAKPAPNKGSPASARKAAGGSKLKAESGTESESESDSETSSSNSPSSKSIPSRPKSTTNQPESDTSSEGTSSSTSSSDSEEFTAQKKAVNGKPSVAKESDESDSSSDEDEKMLSPSAQAKPKAINGQGSSSEASDSESDDEDGEKSALSRTNGHNTAADSTAHSSRASWLNNSEFMLRKASSDNPGKEVADFFSSANLEGKQVWYFTAPASLPITVLKDMEIDLTRAMKGGPLLTHDGDNYALDLESHATNTQIQLLIPSRGGDKYTALNHAIDSTVHLRRMAKFGPGGEVHATATNNYVPVPKPIREQPKGLRVRYTPIGVPSPIIPSVNGAKLAAPGNLSSSQSSTKFRAPSPSSESESESNSDVQMTAPAAPVIPASQAKPAKTDVVNGDRKRKHPGDGNQGTKRLKSGQAATKESSPKKRTPIHPPSFAATSNATPSKQPSSEGKAKKEKTKKDKTPKTAAATPNLPKQTPVPLPSYPGMKH